jgi:hypothetical protein
MKLIAIIFLSAFTLFAQGYKVTNVKGDVKYQSGADENWLELATGTEIGNDAVILTGENSSVQLSNESFTFLLNELSAVSVGSIKKMSLDELLLALAMEDMIDAPKSNGKGSSNNTAVYGTEEGTDENAIVSNNEFGMKRLNGAVQLSENGMEESAVIVGKETYRKYPDTKSIPSYRIFFADILYKKGLYEEALEEYSEINKLELSTAERTKVDTAHQRIKKILLNN